MSADQQEQKNQSLQHEQQHNQKVRLTKLTSKGG